MPYKPGDKVTVIPADTDRYILEFRRYVRVVGRVDGGCMVELTNTSPDLRILGPIPDGRLLPGWRDPDTGAFRWW